MSRPTHYHHKTAELGEWVEFECPMCGIDIDMDAGSQPANGQFSQCPNCEGEFQALTVQTAKYAYDMPTPATV